MTGGIIGGALFVAVLVLACYKGRKRLKNMRSPFPIRSVYRGFPTDIYRDMPRPGVFTIFTCCNENLFLDNIFRLNSQPHPKVAER